MGYIYSKSFILSHNLINLLSAHWSHISAQSSTSHLYHRYLSPFLHHTKPWLHSFLWPLDHIPWNSVCHYVFDMAQQDILEANPCAALTNTANTLHPITQQHFAVPLLELQQTSTHSSHCLQTT